MTLHTNPTNLMEVGIPLGFPSSQSFYIILKRTGRRHLSLPTYVISKELCDMYYQADESPALCVQYSLSFISCVYQSILLNNQIIPLSTSFNNNLQF